MPQLPQSVSFSFNIYCISNTKQIFSLSYQDKSLSGHRRLKEDEEGDIIFLSDHSSITGLSMILRVEYLVRKEIHSVVERRV